MGQGKRKREGKFWCFYCDRKFVDEKTLIDHQRGTHFKCTECGKKLSGAQGLKTHAFRLHKISLVSIPLAKLGRDEFNKCEVYGHTGIPEAYLEKFKEMTGEIYSSEDKSIGLPLEKKRKIEISDKELFEESITNSSGNQGSEKKEMMIYCETSKSMEEKRAEYCLLNSNFLKVSN